MDRFDRAVAEDQQASITHTPNQCDGIETLAASIRLTYEARDSLPEGYSDAHNQLTDIIIDLERTINYLREYPNG